MSGNGNIDDIAQMCFEDALAELESIVRRLEEGAGKLEEAIVAYERGVAYNVIAMRTSGGSVAVDRIVLGRNGAVSSELISLE